MEKRGGLCWVEGEGLEWEKEEGYGRKRGGLWMGKRGRVKDGLWWKKGDGKGWVMGVKRRSFIVGKGGGLWWVEGDGYEWVKREGYGGKRGRVMVGK